MLKILLKIIPFKKIRHRLRAEYTCVKLRRRGNKKSVLLSYIASAVNVKNDQDKRLTKHSNKWECREIARIFLDLGYNVDAIDFDNILFKPRHKYDVIFDIDNNINRLNNFADIKILHLTGSYPRYQIERASKRNDEFNRTHNCNYSYLRECGADYFDDSLNNANYCTLIGNEHTKSTYPEKYQSKIHPVPVTASYLSYIKTKSEFVPQSKEFLFFAGTGCVHKGLDLVLDTFIKHPKWILNVVGAFNSEQDFWNYYNPILKNCPNIHIHGFVIPESEDFIKICKRCFCFVFPSCSEGTASGAITALTVGMFPIISTDCGLDLPEKCGIITDNLTVDGLEKNIQTLMQMSDTKIANQIEKIQSDITLRHSRENFTRSMLYEIKRALKAHD